MNVFNPKLNMSLKEELVVEVDGVGVIVELEVLGVGGTYGSGAKPPSLPLQLRSVVPKVA